MVMVDSNVVIDFWRNPTDDMKRAFLTHERCICGVQIAELLYGAVSEKDSATIENALSSFTLIQIENADWLLLGKFLYKLRKKGITVPFPDALIVSLAIRCDIPVWTRDKRNPLVYRRRHFRYSGMDAGQTLSSYPIRLSGFEVI